MNDLAELQFFAALPIVFLVVGGLGLVAWFIIRVHRATRDKGIF